MNVNQLSALLRMSYPDKDISYKLDGFTAQLQVEYDKDSDTYHFTFSTSNGNEIKFDSRNPLPPLVKGYLRSMYEYYLNNLAN